MKKTIIGITIVGKDREGIVASFTNFVFQQKGNVEKVNQNVIKGLFAKSCKKEQNGCKYSSWD